MNPRRQQWSACPKPGCPQLVNAQNPCPTHGRPVNAHWSSDRDRGKQRQFRKQVLERDGYRCTRCGLHDPSGRALQAHHDTPTTGRTLCRRCHSAVDAHAR